MSRRLLVLLTVLLLTGCAYQDMPTTPEPTGAAPEPAPSGVLYGRVLRQDGRAATRSTVEAYQVSDEDTVRTGFAMFSLGLFCLVPGFCPSPVPAKVDERGGYAFPAEKIKPVKNITVTARHAPEAGQLAGPEVAVSFQHQTGTQQRVPDLRYWEPPIRVDGSGERVTVSWTGLPGDAEYALWTLGEKEQPQSTGITTHETRAVLDRRPYEDRAAAVIVVATSKDFLYRTGSVALPVGTAPPSRNAECKVGDVGKPLVSAVSPCALTDGDLTTNEAVRTPCSAGSSACSQPTRHRICVDLGTPRSVSLVVYRTPFLSDGTVVELTTDGKRFRSVGRTSAKSPDGANDDIRVTRVDPPTTARLACVRNDRFGFSGSVLDEISVW
ncbi:MAG: hypothetical protein HOU81_13290 [Hamadaea sp.]|uniref:hypothetical protein n=1 Tax=Hamadaea sp. TaxID=2024425 RepID=UPI001844BF38|nr:hypothetical protein [Hamadaea sp.]NUR71791.1 hypothetical protein [Hamadaea sp.]NUT23669.1 hypothetical protein [Hamadaea sp.]